MYLETFVLISGRGVVVRVWVCGSREAWRYVCITITVLCPPPREPPQLAISPSATEKATLGIYSRVE